MIEKIGFVVLGQSAVDDIVPALSAQLPPHIQVLVRGALDDLGTDEIEALAPCQGDYLLVCKVQPGREAQVVFDQVFPLVQQTVDHLEADGAELIVILCGANWSRIKSRALVINPGAILPQLVIALSQGKRLGMLMPTVLQVESTQQKYRMLGAGDVTATHVTLYDDADLSTEINAAADFFVDAGVDLIWMPCLGMDDALRSTLQQSSQRPAILAQSMLLKVINELIA